MELIRIEQVDYDYNYETTPLEDEVYINLDFISYVGKRYKKTAEGKGRYIYSVRMNGGCEFLISESCYNRIAGKESSPLPPCPNPKPIGERPEKPEINIGHPIERIW
jgi:hypothetical protein